MSGKYSIAIDRDHDGIFVELGEDIAAHVVGLRWRLGLRQPYACMAAAGEARIVLSDRAGNFSPERNSLAIGTRVRIGYAEEGVSRALFTGFVERVEIDGGEYGNGETIIHLHDMLPWLEANAARLAPLSDVRADQAIDRLLDGATLRRSALAGYCIIDVPGYNRIGVVRPFSGKHPPRRLQKGKTQFPWVGDWWRETTSAGQAICELVESERGRFYVDREGDAIFLNRHHTLVSRAVAASFADDISGMRYAYGADQVNRVSLRMTPRRIGEDDSLIWRLDAPILLDAATQFPLTLRFVDALGEPIGLLRLTRLEAVFHSNAEARGLPLRDGVAAKVERVDMTSAQAQLSNDSSRACWVTDLRVYGKTLYRGLPLEIMLEDGAGIHLNGLRALRLDLPALGDMATARAFAGYELARRKASAGSLRELRLNAREQPTALALTLFDRIRISETRTGQRKAEYFIIGEAHEISQGGLRHEIRFTLERADLARFVIIGGSRIGDANEAIAPY